MPAVRNTCRRPTFPGAPTLTWPPSPCSVLLKEDPILNILRASVGRRAQEQTVHGLLSAESGGYMDPSEVDIHMLAEKVKAKHGEHVYTFALQRALAIASGNSIRTSEELTNDGVLAAVRTELMKLLRPQ